MADSSSVDEERSPAQFDEGLEYLHAAQAEFVERNLGESELEDEQELRREHGSEVYRDQRAPLASDWLEMRQYARAFDDDELEDRNLLAQLLGEAGVREKTVRALEKRDPEAISAALDYEVMLDPHRVLRAIDAIDQALRNALDEGDIQPDPADAPEDDPPVLRPRRPSKGRRG